MAPEPRIKLSVLGEIVSELETIPGVLELVSRTSDILRVLVEFLESEKMSGVLELVSRSSDILRPSVELIFKEFVEVYLEFRSSCSLRLEVWVCEPPPMLRGLVVVV